MTTTVLATLDDFADTFRSNGYEVAVKEFQNSVSVLLAESPYALVCCFETSAWSDLFQRVSDVQAELTQIAVDGSPAHRWDLYVFVHMLIRPSGPVEEEEAEDLEADTRYARKFVRIAIPRNDAAALEKALRPLLPLHPVPQFDNVDPFDALRSELYDLNVAHELVDTALAAFSQNGEIEVS